MGGVRRIDAGDFEKDTGIHVDLQTLTWDDIRPKLVTALIAGTAPADVTEFDWSWTGQFNAADWYLPLNDAIDKDTVADIPTTTTVGQAFVGDLRSTSGLGLGDGLKTHTDKWLQGGGQKTPMEYIQSAEPIKVHGAVVASHGSEFLFFFVFSC